MERSALRASSSRASSTASVTRYEMMDVHETAIVDRDAELGDDVRVGPFCEVHAGARLGAGTRLVSHVVVHGTTVLGAGNVVHPFAVLGGEAQVLRREGEGVLVIGERNVIREGATLNASNGSGATRVGSSNLLMAGCHIGHDVIVGSHCVVANAVQLAGHSVVEDWVTFGGLSGLAQRVRVGESAFVAAGAMCERDVPPFVIVQGDRARVRGLNVVGLERRGVPSTSIRALRDAYAHLFGRTLLADGLRTLDRSDPFVGSMAAWLEHPSRNLRPFRSSATSISEAAAGRPPRSPRDPAR